MTESVDPGQQSHESYVSTTRGPGCRFLFHPKASLLLCAVSCVLAVGVMGCNKGQPASQVALVVEFPVDFPVDSQTVLDGMTVSTSSDNTPPVFPNLMHTFTDKRIDGETYFGHKSFTITNDEETEVFSAFIRRVDAPCFEFKIRAKCDYRMQIVLADFENGTLTNDATKEVLEEPFILEPGTYALTATLPCPESLTTIPTPEEAFAELRASSCVQYEWRRHKTDPWESFTIDSEEGRSRLACWLLEHEKEMEACFDYRGGLSIQPGDVLLWERSNSAIMDVALIYGYPKARDDGTFPQKRDMEMVTNFTKKDLESLRELFKKYGRPSDR